jgi:cytochrome c biogenesis protein CcmG, thiol:disulfide interchange protein DsbE
MPLQMQSSQQARRANVLPRGSLFYLAPLIVLMSMAAVFGSLLSRDPELLPSALLGKSVPVFSLPPVAGKSRGLASTDLQDEPSLVNVFASWCTACRTEHPLLLELRTRGVALHGLNYKDAPQDAAKWLGELEDPYIRTGADLSGRVAIDWGVYGVPETFVISADGRILYKHIGPLTVRAINETILPLMKNAAIEGK